MRAKPYVTSKRVPSRKYGLTAAKVLLLAARKRAQKFPIVSCSLALSSSNWFPLTQRPQNFSYSPLLLSIEHFPSVLGRKCDTILNHTALYEYKHGKMLMHLKFCFERLPDRQTPAATLRYYRQRKGLTTRQLAEQIGIVPATVLMYEREQFPIPYPTAVAFADILEIDRNLLFDEFARFIDYPYSDRLREVRKACGLNQADFANKAGISLSIYTKWESGARQPSRKMYRQLATVYPEIKI